MKTTKINHIIEDFNSLVLIEKEYTLDIIRKMMVEAKREAISKKAAKASANLQKGKVKKGSVKDMYTDLERD